MLTAIQVRETQLPTTFMRQAYNQDQVNDLVDRIAATLSAYELDMAILPARAVTASEVLNYRFDSVRFTKGYDRLAVNDLLHQAAKALGVWEKRYDGSPEVTQSDDASAASYQQATEQPTVAVRQATDINVLSSSAVSSAQFPRHKFFEGYACEEVDDLLAKVVEALASYERGSNVKLLGSKDVEAARFTPTKFFTVGYEQDYVDEFLDRVVSSLEYWEEHA